MDLVGRSHNAQSQFLQQLTKLQEHFPEGESILLSSSKAVTEEVRVRYVTVLSDVEVDDLAGETVPKRGFKGRPTNDTGSTRGRIQTRNGRSLSAQRYSDAVEKRGLE